MGYLMKLYELQVVRSDKLDDNKITARKIPIWRWLYFEIFSGKTEENHEKYD
jgi:hypothetical protein